MATQSVELAKPILASDVEKILIGGDLGKLTAEQRLSYYNAVCRSLNLNPLTKPFAYIQLNGKLTLYALKDCTEQLRTIHVISLAITAREVIEGVYVVTARAHRPDGRFDESTGAVPIDNLKGESRANAMMKAETKAKRRVTLSICGLGMLDESETSEIQGARVHETPRGDGEQKGAVESPTVETPPPAQTAPEVPVPLKAIFAKLHEPGRAMEAFKLLRARMEELSPEGYEATYKRIQKEHGITLSSTVAEYKACLLEMWGVCEEWSKQQTMATDEDLPRDLFNQEETASV
jgi:hypothetical protein